MFTNKALTRFKVVKTILALIAFITLFQVNGQIHYNFSVTSSSQTIELSRDVMTTFNGDSLGAFVLRGTEYICVGSTLIDESIVGNQTFSAYGQVADTLGYELGDSLFFMRKNEPNGCNTYAQAEIDSESPLSFTPGDTSLITSMPNQNLRVRVDYDDPTCQFVPNATPVVNIPHVLTYRLISPNLDIDSTTGFINIANSQPGNYDIRLHSNYCQAQANYVYRLREFPMETLNRNYYQCQGDTVSVPLTEQNGDLIRTPVSAIPSALTDDIQLIYRSTFTNGCETLDTITIDVFNIPENDIIISTANQVCQEPGLILVQNDYLEDTISSFFLNGDQSFSNEMSAETGTYQLVLEGREACLDTLATSVEILREGSCPDQLYLSPNQNGPSIIEFKESGEIQIMDNNGLVIQSLFGPTTWHGQDQNGQLLKNGLYIVIFENGDTKTLNVIN